MSLCNSHADKYAADQVYTLRYLSMSDAGGLTLLTAELDRVNSVAKYAFVVLQRLLAKDILPTEQTAANEALLARMQGLRRCSGLLCPLFSQDQALQAQRGDAFSPLLSPPHPPHPPPSTCLYCWCCACILLMKIEHCITCCCTVDVHTGSASPLLQRYRCIK